MSKKFILASIACTAIFQLAALLLKVIIYCCILKEPILELCNCLIVCYLRFRKASDLLKEEIPTPTSLFHTFFLKILKLKQELP